MESDASPAPLAVRIIRKLARLGRFLLFLLTAGWAYPHVCTEGMDLTKIQNDHMARKS
jgi:hypothetical protein